MKTKKVRPVFILSNPNNETSGGVFNEKDRNWYNIYLISLDPDDKIEVGDKYLDDCGQIREAVTNDKDYWDRRPEYDKVIATQDQIPPEYIQQFIDKYNNGEAKDFEIEWAYQEGEFLTELDSCPWREEINRPKLTNGFVTIVETEDEDLFSKFRGSSILPKNKEESTREPAMAWWNNLSSLHKTQLCDTNTDKVGFARRWETLTGREIETLWLQGIDKGIISTKVEELVDFERISMMANSILFEAITERLPGLKDDLNNLQLFLQKLSESGSFAHKAHKELQRLNK